MHARGASAILLSLCATTAGAAGDTPKLPGAENFLTTALGLAVILGIIFAGAWLLRRFGALPAGGRGMVRVLGGASLGARERIVVVQVEDARLVLGVAPGRVEMLHRLPKDEDFDAALDQAREQGR